MMLKYQLILLLWLLCVSYLACNDVYTKYWKDKWIIDFIKRNEPSKQELLGFRDSFPCHEVKTSSRIGTKQCKIPKYIPARKSSQQTGKIPKVIWQSWKSNVVDFHMYEAIRNWAHMNPDYEYFLFDDVDSLEFMCHCASTRTLLAYELLIPGAAKCDMWRLAIVERYGGVYADIDSTPKKSLSSFVWSNASMVSSIGKASDLAQWCLIYAPKHPILKTAIDMATEEVISVYTNKSFKPVVDLTGPNKFHQAALSILSPHNCVLWKFDESHHRHHRSHKQDVYGDHLPNHMCAGAPEVGVIQLFQKDCIGDKITFKAKGVDEERDKKNHTHYGMLDRSFETLFHSGINISSYLSNDKESTRCSSYSSV